MLSRIAMFMLVAVLGTAAQQNLQNAKVETLSAAAGLEQTVQAVAAKGQTAWIGYAVPAVEDAGTICCFEGNNYQSAKGCCGQCRLESGSGGFTINRGDSACEALNASDEVRIFYRMAEGRIQKVRAFTSNCAVDAGGLPVYLLSEVRPAESIAFLTKLARDSADDKKRTSGSVMAIAMHADASADNALAQLIAPGNHDRLRKDAAFWMGTQRGRAGYLALKNAIATEAGPAMRKKFIFPLSQNREEAATDELIRLARHDQDSSVRGEALFWLAQKAGHKAAAAITDAIENDPETAVKKKAVFALSNLPNDEGVPLLIKLARTHQNPAVRKQAMFWLGQSKDRRAVEFFAEILKN